MSNIKNIEEMSAAILDLIESQVYIPMDMRDMTNVLELEPAEYDRFAETIDILVKSGVIMISKKGNIIKAADGGRINGIFLATTRGFGFVKPDSNPDLEIYIGKNDVNGAMHGDRVQIRLLSSGNDPSGEVVLVLEHGVSEFVGSLQESFVQPPRAKKGGRKYPKPTMVKRYYVIPDNPKLTFRVRIPTSMKNGAVDGDKVVCKIQKYQSDPNSRLNENEGSILEVFGREDSRTANYQSILYENGIRTKFSEEVLSEAEKVASEPITADSRLDLRDKLIFTIDGPDAKDFDDAISIERLDKGWILGVHIADVSHYVKSGSAIDREAFERGTSIYFTDKVVPMLPEQLSNGVCSLNRDTDKYTLSAFIKLDEDGKILETTLERAIISSKVRGVYPEINDLIEKREESEYYEKYAFLLEETLPNMLELFNILKKRSDERGALEIETVEPKFVLDSDGIPKDIILLERGISEQLIEQFMLTANRAVAEWLNNLGMPCIYRTHEEPSPEKVQTLAMFAHNLGLNAAPLRRKKQVGVFRELCKEAREKGVESVLTVMLLRSMMKAKYSSVAASHFGLGCDLYCHFTSPIRRYPDLAVHRIISAVLDGTLNFERLEAFAESAALKSNENELRALSAERDIEDLYRVLYMKDKMYQKFDGVISSVTGFGLFVELDNTCEGLVSISDMDGYFDYDDRAQTLKSKDLVYHLGDRVRVKLVGCDLVSRRISFELV